MGFNNNVTVSNESDLVLSLLSAKVDTILRNHIHFFIFQHAEQCTAPDPEFLLLVKGVALQEWLVASLMPEAC